MNDIVLNTNSLPVADQLVTTDFASCTRAKGACAQADDELVRFLAVHEGVAPGDIRARVTSGKIVTLSTKCRTKILGVGKGLTTKVNANVGTSSEKPDYQDVVRKARLAVRAGAHSLMDLSTVGIDGYVDFAGGIKAVVEATGAVVGTVPVYEGARRAMIRLNSKEVHLDANELLECVERQAEAGSRFMVIHVGLNKKTLAVWRRQPRNIVSKGGYLTAEYMLKTGQENPFYERFDDLLKILRRHDVVLNIGSALRSGATRFNDRAQLAELRSAAELARIANANQVQVVLEGPGHVPYRMISRIVSYQRRISGSRPFFILGFVTTDAFVGHDHIVSAIGATEAVRHGVSWLCYITPAEHVRMPTDKDVVEGVRAALIAAHVGDCANEQPKALALENQKNDKGCLDNRAKRQFCSICGQDFCQIQRLHDLRATNSGSVV